MKTILKEIAEEAMEFILMDSNTAEVVETIKDIIR